MALLGEEGYGGLNLVQHCNKNYSIDMLIMFNIAYSTSSMVSCSITAAILIAMVFYKAYHTTLQRLFIYLNTVIIIYLVAASFSLQLHPKIFQYTGDRLCKWTGYFQASVYTSTLLISLEISAYLFYMMWYQVQGKPLPVPTRAKTVALEATALFVGVVTPLGLLMLPLSHYGVGGTQCWVKLYDNDSCNISSASETLGTFIFSMYTILMSINLLAYILLVVIFCWLACKFQQSREQYLHTAKRTAALIVMLVAYTGLHLSAIVVVHYILEREILLHNGEVVFSIVTPLSQLIRPLAYMFFFNSVKKFRWEGTKTAASEWKQSWTFFCLRWCRCLGRRRGTLMINDLGARSSESLTPAVLTSSNYESLGRTIVE